MATRPRVIFLLAVMLWQTAVWLTPFAMETQREQIAHWNVHAMAVDHHHHADASLHLDSDGPAHAHADPGFQPLGTAARGAPVALLLLPVDRPNTGQAVPPDAPRQRLLRPPRAA